MMELSTRYRELQALHEISQTVLNSLDLQCIVEGILDKTLSVGSFDLGVIRLLDSGAKNLEALAKRGYQYPENVRHLSIDPITQGCGTTLIRVITEKATQVVENVPESDGWRTFKREGVQSAIVVPVLAQGRILGTIQLGSRKSRKFGPDEIHLLEAIGSQMGIAVQKARLSDQTERRAREISALNTVTIAVSTALNLDETLEKSLHAVLLITGMETGYIQLLTPDSSEFILKVHQGISPSFAEKLLAGAQPGGKTKQIIATKRPIVLESMEPDRVGKFQGEGITAAAWVPIMSQEKVLGIIAVATRGAQTFNSDQLHLLESIGASVGVALEKARLFEEVKRKSLELESLVKINRDVAALLDRDVLLPRIAEEARKILKVDSSVFRLVEEEYLVLRNVLNPEKLNFRPKLRLDESLSGKIYRENRVMAISNILKDPTIIAEHRDILRSAGYHSFLGVPLQTRDRVIGTLSFYSKEEREFQPEEISIITSFADQAAIAVKNATLYYEARRQEQIQKLLEELSQDITSLDINSLVQKVTEKVREFFEVDISDVRIAGGWQPVGVSGIDPERIRGSGTMRGRSTWILENRRPLVIADITQETSISTGSTTRQIGVRGYLGVPLFSRGAEVIGVLRALTYQPREFTQEEVDLLQQLANGTAVALENARLFQETGRRAQEQSALNAIASATTQSLQLDELLKTALNKVLEVTGRDRGYIRLKNPATGALILAAHRGISEKYIDVLLHGRKPGGKGDQVFESGEPLVVNDPEGTLLKEETRQEGLHCTAWIPLKARGKVVGILNVSTTRQILFTPREIELLQAIGNVIGVAVENARLFGETQRSLDQVRALREIEQAMSSTLDLQKVLDVFLEKMTLLFPYPTVTTVRLLNKEKDWLEPVACRNLDAEQWKKEQAASGRGLTYHAFNNSAPLVVNDLTKDQRVSEEGFCRRHRLASYMGVPLIAKGECLGVIGLYTLEKHRFTDEELDLLSTLAGQAALAIHNAQLYYEMKKLADYLAVANKVKDEFLSVMSHELRTPLNTLVGYTEMVRDKLLGDINEKQEGALGTALTHAGNLLSMINSVLLTTQMDAGMVKVESDEVNLGEFLDKLKLTYNVPLPKDIALLWDYPSNPKSIKTDSNRLKLILQNLINNGIKFTQKGHVTISARHIPRSRSAEFKVVDTGIGIQKKYLATIFEKFRQVDSSETRLYGGVGLGLYIAKQMTQRIGGTLEVNSEPGKGSTFTVKIPCEM